MVSAAVEITKIFLMASSVTYIAWSILHPWWKTKSDGVVAIVTLAVVGPLLAYQAADNLAVVRFAEAGLGVTIGYSVVAIVMAYFCWIAVVPVFLEAENEKKEETASVEDVIGIIYD